MDISSEERYDFDGCYDGDGQELSALERQHPLSAGDDNIVNEVGVLLGEAVRVKEEHSATFGGMPCNEEHGEECLTKHANVEEGCSNNIGSVPAASGKQLSKSATFSSTDFSPQLMDGETGTPSVDVLETGCHSRSVSLPTPRKLISALKGSREKQEACPKTLSVSWAPDVYDPPPTSLSHSPKKKNKQQDKNKKHGKGKQKGKNVRNGGSSPKDKKHHRKTGGRSERCMNIYSNNESILSSNYYKSTTDLFDFDEEEVDSPDSNCGSRFLRKERGRLRVAYAEAT